MVPWYAAIIHSFYFHEDLSNRPARSLVASVTDISSCPSSESAYISMQVAIFPVLAIGGMGSVSYYVYFLDLYIPRRRVRNMVHLVLGGKPIFLRRTSRAMGVYGVILARKGLSVLKLGRLI